MSLDESGQAKSRFRPFPLPEGDPHWKQIGEKLSEDDHARIVERQVNELDRQVLDDLYRGSGSLAYDLVPLLKMVLYQYLKGKSYLMPSERMADDDIKARMRSAARPSNVALPIAKAIVAGIVFMDAA